MKSKEEDNIWELVAGNLHHELDQEEQTSLDQAIENHSNKAIYNRSEQIFNGLANASLLRSADKQKSWKRIDQKVNREIIQIRFRKFIKYAAILVLAFISGLYFQSLTKLSAKDVQYAEIEVMYGQTGHLFLFDGTEVWLNSGSKFKYPNQFNQTERKVFLEGEAFFKVAHNKNLPFKVNTAKLQVEVHGTSFNVSAYPDELNQTVVLEEGSVQINNPDGKKIGMMAPGQIAIKAKDAPGVKIGDINPYSFTCWKDGKVIFDGERLGDIAKKIERWYNVEIKFEKERLKDYKFTGTILRNKPIDQSILALELLAPIRFRYEIKTAEKNVLVIVEK